MQILDVDNYLLAVIYPAVAYQAGALGDNYILKALFKLNVILDINGGLKRFA